MQTLTIEVGEAGENKITKSFQGEWLIQDISPEQDDSGVTWDGGTKYSVAKTARGQLLVYEFDERNYKGTYRVFADFDDLNDAEIGPCAAVPRNVVALVANALDIEYVVEVDI
jgi:hypothetical protein